MGPWDECDDRCGNRVRSLWLSVLQRFGKSRLPGWGLFIDEGGNDSYQTKDGYGLSSQRGIGGFFDLKGTIRINWLRQRLMETFGQQMERSFCIRAVDCLSIVRAR